MDFQTILLKSLSDHMDRTAILAGEEEISYSEVSLTAHKVTSFLLKEGLEGEIIGIQLKNKFSLICSIIGVVNARCTFVLLDGSLPEKRLEEIAGELKLSSLISSADCTASLFWTTQPDLKIYLTEDILEQEKDLVISGLSYPDYEGTDSLYIYFTSGSTGKPKGIIGKNSSLLQFINWEIAEFSLDQNCRVSQLISPYFDAFLRDIFVPLLSGGMICIPPQEEDFFTPEYMGSWIERAEVSLIHCVPSVFRLLNHGRIEPGSFPKLQYILLSGEKIIPGELVKWYETFKERIQLVNLYGATETTMIRTFYRIKPFDAQKARIPIGFPIADTKILIADDQMRQVNKLVTGDLYIISDYTAKGYLNAPELTRQKFIVLYQGTPAETIAFKTGDKARMLAGGEIDLLGREDRQVKLRGIRIEPDEIENRLIASEKLKNAVVLKSNGENEMLIGFVIKADDYSPQADLAEELIVYLKSYLPAYMIPGQIVALTEYPLLSNGKMDYNKLLSNLDTYITVTPDNEIETRLLAIWKEILGDKAISTTHNFHQIGGSSLGMMRLIGRIFKDFKIRVTLSELFNNLTIQKQAALIDRSTADNLYVIEKSPVKAGYNLSSAQYRMYYQYILNPSGTAFNLPMAWRIKGSAEMEKIEEAFRLLIERHEILRTSFLLEDDQVRQVVHEEIDFHLEYVKAEENKSVQELLSAFIKPFDLGKAPLIRCAIIETKAKESILIVDIHHIVCDGMSQLNLATDFMRYYKGEKLSPLSIQYKDFAEWEYNFKTTAEYIAHREFWLKSFEGDILQLRLPSTAVISKEKDEEGGRIAFEIDKKVLGPVIESLRSANVTTSSVLFAMYFIYLAQLTGQEDMVIGLVSAGRMQNELLDGVGMFAKTLPVRYKIDPELSFIAAVTELHEYLVKAQSKQVFDLLDLAAELKHNRTISDHGLIQALFLFQNFERNQQQAEGSPFEMLELEGETAKYPLTMYVYEEPERFDFHLEYQSQYFKKADMELLTERFITLVKALSADSAGQIINCLSTQQASAVMLEEEIKFNF